MAEFWLKDDALKYIEKNYRYIDFAKFKVNAYFMCYDTEKKEVVRTDGRITGIYGNFFNLLAFDGMQWKGHISSLDPTSLGSIARKLSEINGD